jgi:hypothetical protein
MMRATVKNGYRDYDCRVPRVGEDLIYSLGMTGNDNVAEIIGDMRYAELFKEVNVTSCLYYHKNVKYF